jgi:hypothetical protein
VFQFIVKGVERPFSKTYGGYVDFFLQYLTSFVEIDLFFITLSCAWWIRDAPPVVPAPHPQMSLPGPLPGCHDYQLLISPKSGDQVLQVNAPYNFYLHALFPFII